MGLQSFVMIMRMFPLPPGRERERVRGGMGITVSAGLSEWSVSSWVWSWLPCCLTSALSPGTEARKDGRLMHIH